ncbi:MAG: anaerobic ribonucleoside-triphosphate reductase activating protein [Candidatus Omnitrophica bacterium]|nr:anaerobic ribonucleoside-triphosphate reductase activating protein [Candidatus Omnitrophota bacterium]
MKIGGFKKFSLIDYPGKISAVVFTQGCNYRCSYCHNPELVYPELFNSQIPPDDIFSFLSQRKGMLEGVVITGGEPLLQPELTHFIHKIRNLGFLVKLDTNGSAPDKLFELLSSEFLDYVAMDIKAPFDKYHLVSGCEVNLADIKKSIRMIEVSGINYHFRTTFDGEALDEADIEKITYLLKNPLKYSVQECLSTETKQLSIPL